MTTLLPALLALAVIHLVGAMVPGPNIVVTAQIAASRSARDGLKCVAGIVVATLTWVSLTLAGVGIVLQELGSLYTALKLVGAAYLLWLGGRMLWAAIRHAPASGAEVGVGVGSADSPLPPGRTRGRLPYSAFRSGLLTNLTNPKSAIFWTSVFVVAIPPEAPAWFYGAVIAVIGVQTALWYGLVALVFAAPPTQAAYARMGRVMEGLAGSVMVGFGLKLAVDAQAAP